MEIISAKRRGGWSRDSPSLVRQGREDESAGRGRWAKDGWAKGVAMLSLIIKRSYYKEVP